MALDFFHHFFVCCLVFHTGKGSLNTIFRTMQASDPCIYSINFDYWFNDPSKTTYKQ